MDIKLSLDRIGSAQFLNDQMIRYNIFRKLKKEQKDRHAQRTLVE